MGGILLVPAMILGYWLWHCQHEHKAMRPRHKAIFNKAMTQKNPKVLAQVADVFGAEGYPEHAAALRARANLPMLPRGVRQEHQLQFRQALSSRNPAMMHQYAQRFASQGMGHVAEHLHRHAAAFERAAAIPNFPQHFHHPHHWPHNTEQEPGGMQGMPAQGMPSAMQQASQLMQDPSILPGDSGDLSFAQPPPPMPANAGPPPQSPFSPAPASPIPPPPGGPSDYGQGPSDSGPMPGAPPPGSDYLDMSAGPIDPSDLTPPSPS